MHVPMYQALYDSPHRSALGNRKSDLPPSLFRTILKTNIMLLADIQAVRDYLT